MTTKVPFWCRCVPKNLCAHLPNELMRLLVTYTLGNFASIISIFKPKITSKVLFTTSQVKRPYFESFCYRTKVIWKKSKKWHFLKGQLPTVHTACLVVGGNKFCLNFNWTIFFWVDKQRRRSSQQIIFFSVIIKFLTKRVSRAKVGSLHLKPSLQEGLTHIRWKNFRFE